MQLSALSRKSTVMSILLLVAILISVTLRYWFAPFEVELANRESSGKFIFVLIAMVLYLVGGLVQGKILSRSGLCGSYCAFPMPIYALLTCGIFVAPDMLATSIASLFFTVALYLLLRSLHTVEETDSVFFASVLLGVAALLYPPCVVLIVAIPVAVFTLALSLRQALLMLIGYFIPLFVASYIIWYGGGGFLDLASKLCSAISTSQMAAVEKIPYVSIVFTSIALFLIVWGVVYAAIRPTKTFTLTRVRRALYLFLWLLLLSATMFAMPGRDLSACAIIAVPATVLLSFALDVLPANLSTISYWTLLITFVVHLFVA
jgi:hypothetical protein